jgi:hypothetical protein
LGSQLVTYLITFAAHGHRLHGSESGSVEGEHKLPGTPILKVDLARARWLLTPQQISAAIQSVLSEHPPPRRIAYSSRNATIGST